METHKLTASYIFDVNSLIFSLFPREYLQSKKEHKLLEKLANLVNSSDFTISTFSVFFDSMYSLIDFSITSDGTLSGLIVSFKREPKFLKTSAIDLLNENKINFFNRMI